MSSNFYGDDTRFFVGVVEDNDDPLEIGRVRVRCFGVHSPYLNDIQIEDLPWASVLLPATEGGTSGIGRSPNGLLPGTYVFGMFLDGKTSQSPLVFGSIPKVETTDGNNISAKPHDERSG